MADDGIGATGHEPSICGGKTEGTAEGQERGDADRQSEQLDPEPDGDTPIRMSTHWPQQHAGEGSAERKHPVARPCRDRPCRASDEVRDHNPNLLYQKRGTDESMRAHVEVQRCLCKVSSTDGSDQVGEYADEPRRMFRAEAHCSGS